MLYSLLFSNSQQKVSADCWMKIKNMKHFRLEYTPSVEVKTENVRDF